MGLRTGPHHRSQPEPWRQPIAAGEVSLARLAGRFHPEQVRGLVEQAGGLVDALDRSDPALRAQLYEELGIDGVYDPNSHTVHLKVELGRRIGRVGGGT